MFVHSPVQLILWIAFGWYSHWECDATLHRKTTVLQRENSNLDFNFLFNPTRFLFSLFARDGLKYFERSTSFHDQNAVKVKSGFDAVTDVVCMVLGEPFSLSILKLIIFPNLWQKITAVAHFFATKWAEHHCKKLNQHVFLSRQTWMGWRL